MCGGEAAHVGGASLDALDQLCDVLGGRTRRAGSIREALGKIGQLLAHLVGLILIPWLIVQLFHLLAELAVVERCRSGGEAFGRFG